MIRAVIFDMFETLITHFESPLYFGAQMALDAGIQESKFLELWRPTEIDRTIGRMTLEEVIEMILTKNKCYSEDLLNAIVQKRIADKEDCFNHLDPEIIPLLKQLKEKGIMIGLISNCFSEETTVIRNSVLFPFFDVVLLSYEQGVMKPDVTIFKRSMDKMMVKPDECLYVGDGGSQELETSRNLGMNTVQAVWYLKEGTKQPVGRKQDFVQVERPLDLLDIIRKHD